MAKGNDTYSMKINRPILLTITSYCMMFISLIHIIMTPITVYYFSHGFKINSMGYAVIYRNSLTTTWIVDSVIYLIYIIVAIGFVQLKNWALYGNMLMSILLLLASLFAEYILYYMPGYGVILNNTGVFITTFLVLFYRGLFVYIWSFTICLLPGVRRAFHNAGISG